MNKSESIGKLALALSKAQGEMKGRYGSQKEGILIRSILRATMPRNYRGQKYKTVLEAIGKNTGWGLSSCMYWTGSIHRQGYGVFGKKNIFAHRLVWQLFNGEIPKGMHVLHKCDVPLCCNPEHLFLGTHKDNMKDMDKKGRRHISRGQDQALSKLTNEQVQEIRSTYVKGKKSTTNIPALANKFNVTAATIGYILQRKTWRHI